METIKRISKTEVDVDGCVYRKVESAYPVFKMGDAVMITRNGQNASFFRSKNPAPNGVYSNKDWAICAYKIASELKPIYFDSLKEYQSAYLLKDYEGNEVGYVYNAALRHATKDEIESHLKKICDEKYTEGVKIKSIGTDRYTFTYNNNLWWDGDSLHMVAKEKEWKGRCSDPFIYHNGKWAEIIPDKKKLPKTKAEFNVFLRNFSGHIDLPFPPNVISFLNDYE